MTANKTVSPALQLVIDFAMGVAVFALVVACASAGPSMAFAGADLFAPSEPGGWATKVAFASGQGGIGWNPMTRDAAILLLAVGSGAIAALNLAIARQMRALATGASAPGQSCGPLSAGPTHTNF